VSENLKRFTIPKTTGTHGDVFAATGLADLLSDASSEPVRIRDNGLAFEISASLTDSIPQNPGYPFLKSNDKVRVPAGITDFVDYKAEKAKADRRRKLLEGKNRKSLGPEIEELLKQDELRPDWRLLQVLNVLQGDETTNRTYLQINSMRPAEFSGAVSGALGALAAFQPSGLDWPVSSVQLFSPNSAKGYSRLKPDSIGRNDKTKEGWVDPFVEWLRYRGYFAVACPLFEGPKAENVRLLCPIPADVSFGALKQICAELRKSALLGGAPKLDILATLQLAKLMINHSQEYHDSATAPIEGLALTGRTPADVISGISVTQYQSLGNAKAVSSMAVLAIPGWFSLNLSADAISFLAILDEHQRAVRSLNDNHSDEIGLLVLYRRFLEFRGEPAIYILLDFMARYGALLLAKRGQGPRVTQFSTANLGRLIMSNAARLGPVLADDGFQAVATAIRNATVNAQAQKAMNQANYREIRYELIPELRRKSSLPGNEPLIQTLSDFVSKYNIENARRRELGKFAPRNITTDEFSSLVHLIEQHSAATLGPMLCAYGSCRVQRDDTDKAEPATLDDGQE
jgi:hypothetical protein